VPSDALWSVDCKYYTASINIKTGSFQNLPQSKDLTEALVVMFDPKNESSVGALFAYADQMKGKKLDVCLAVCENFENAVETYETISQFCSESAFELVELKPEQKFVAGADEANEESARYESKDEYGVTRVLNALLANPWTGMKRKKWTPPTRKGESEEAAAAEGEEGSGDAIAASKSDGAQPSNPEAEVLADSCASQIKAVFKKDDAKASEAAAGSVDAAMDDLLSKLKQLKAKSAGMTDDDRKKYAEKVAKSFAEATGVED